MTPKHRLPGWWRRAAMLLAHAQPAVLTAVIAVDTARHVTDAPAVAVALAHGCVLGAALLAFFADHYHQHRLCPRCTAATGGTGGRPTTSPLAAATPLGC